MATNEIYDPSNLDKYHYKEDASRFQRFLWNCAGADEQILLKCPHSDRVKMEGLGGIVLATAILAWISGREAASIILSSLGEWKDLVSIIPATIWALIIFNLDRFIVSSTGHGDGKTDISWGELKGAIPRIILGVAIGLSLSAPLELKIMKPEIESELQVRMNKQAEILNQNAEKDYKAEEARITAERMEAVNRLKEKESQALALDSQIQDLGLKLGAEIQGKVGSGKAGDGPASKQMRQQIEEMKSKRESDGQAFAKEKTELEEKVKQKTAELDDLNKKYLAKKSENNNLGHQLDGISKRIQIAHEIAPAIHWALFFLLLALEITPIFIKMMIATGPYDLLSENQRQIIYAKYAIHTEGAFNVKENEGSNNWLEGIRFTQAEVVSMNEVEKLDAEAKLAKVAREVFEQNTEKEIRENPHNFIDNSKV